jgi:membrane dipeptidase
LGLVIDLSHCGDQVTMDAIKYLLDTLLITHSNPRTLVDHPRNKTDKQIKALAKKWCHRNVRIPSVLPG